MKTCEDCKYCLQDDYGYSNYTTEGTYVHCLKGSHPESGFDSFYGEDKRLKFAETCPDFKKGEGVCLDCDREGLKNYNDPLSSAYTDDEEIKRLLDEWEKAES